MDTNGVSTENTRELDTSNPSDTAENGANNGEEERSDSAKNNEDGDEQGAVQTNEDEEIDVVGVSDRESGSPKDIDPNKSENGSFIVLRFTLISPSYIAFCFQLQMNRKWLKRESVDHEVQSPRADPSPPSPILPQPLEMTMITMVMSIISIPK